MRQQSPISRYSCNNRRRSWRYGRQKTKEAVTVVHPAQIPTRVVDHNIGHTITGHITKPAFYGKLPYDTEHDFSPITLIASVPHTIVAHPSLPVKNLKELIALAKAHPGEINYASFGNGSTSHLSGELFNSMTGITLVHIPYKGGGPALIDTLAGHVPLFVIDYVNEA